MGKKNITCSFCRRNAQTVKTLVKGIDGSICRDCTEFSLKIFQQNEDHESSQRQVFIQPVTNSKLKPPMATISLVSKKPEDK